MVCNCNSFSQYYPSLAVECQEFAFLWLESTFSFIDSFFSWKHLKMADNGNLIWSQSISLKKNRTPAIYLQLVGVVYSSISAWPCEWNVCTLCVGAMLGILSVTLTTRGSVFKCSLLHFLWSLSLVLVSNTSRSLVRYKLISWFSFTWPYSGNCMTTLALLKLRVAIS